MSFTIHMTDKTGANLGTYQAAKFPESNDLITDPANSNNMRRILTVITVNFPGRSYDAMVNVGKSVPLAFWVGKTSVESD